MARMDAMIRKAIFPAAGLGTRFLPATKAQPKEMLVLVDKPVIQYGVEEAVAKVPLLASLDRHACRAHVEPRRHHADVGRSATDCASERGDVGEHRSSGQPR